MDLGKVGVWWSGSWNAHDRSLDVAAELETLGYGALWSSGGFEPGLSSHFERLLASTARLTVASGIVSIWASSPEQIAAAAADLEAKYEGRFLLGLGASHAPIVENYSRPYARMVGYLDGLDVAGSPVSADRRVLPPSVPGCWHCRANGPSAHTPISSPSSTRNGPGSGWGRAHSSLPSWPLLSSATRPRHANWREGT
jgi:probable F420-dependent oxidoreductase